MEINMAKKIKGEDKINDTTLHELLLMMDARLKHIEDITADDRAVLIKLVKQTNQIVEFLKQIELDPLDNYEDPIIPSLEDKSISIEKSEKVKALLDEFLSKRESLKEFEKELKKHKDMLTPGQIGEA
mgnify:CR=1 FL=1|tara:strand:+ start:337 stop:720 length:384 start_codon:yes stop_codon:yes gene_type:complete